jgi:hypothetical protein
MPVKLKNLVVVMALAPGLLILKSRGIPKRQFVSISLGFRKVTRLANIRKA